MLNVQNVFSSSTYCINTGGTHCAVWKVIYNLCPWPIEHWLSAQKYNEQTLSWFAFMFCKVSVWFSKEIKPTFHFGDLVVKSIALLKAGWKLVHSGFACTYSNYNSSCKLYLFHNSHKIMNQLCGSFSNGWIGKDYKYVQHSILPKLLPTLSFI